MIKYFCDGCKKEFPSSKLKAVWSDGKVEFSYQISLSLCNKCYNKMLKFIKNDKN